MDSMGDGVRLLENHVRHQERGRERATDESSAARDGAVDADGEAMAARAAIEAADIADVAGAAFADFADAADPVLDEDALTAREEAEFEVRYRRAAELGDPA